MRKSRWIGYGVLVVVLLGANVVFVMGLFTMVWGTEATGEVTECHETRHAKGTRTSCSGEWTTVDGETGSGGIRGRGTIGTDVDLVIGPLGAFTSDSVFKYNAMITGVPGLIDVMMVFVFGLVAVFNKRSATRVQRFRAEAGPDVQLFMVDKKGIGELDGPRLFISTDKGLAQVGFHDPTGREAWRLTGKSDPDSYSRRVYLNSAEEGALGYLEKDPLGRTLYTIHDKHGRLVAEPRHGFGRASFRDERGKESAASIMISGGRQVVRIPRQTPSWLRLLILGAVAGGEDWLGRPGLGK